MPVWLPGDMQPDGVQMRATRLDLFLQNQQPVDAHMTLHRLLPSAPLWVYTGIWRVSSQIKPDILF